MFSEKQEEQLKQMPAIQTRISKSKDGKYVIHKTEITSIKPASYYEAVLNDKEEVLEVAAE